MIISCVLYFLSESRDFLLKLENFVKLFFFFSNRHLEFLCILPEEKQLIIMKGSAIRVSCKDHASSCRKTKSVV